MSLEDGAFEFEQASQGAMQKDFAGELSRQVQNDFIFGDLSRRDDGFTIQRTQSQGGPPRPYNDYDPYINSSPGGKSNSSSGQSDGGIVGDVVRFAGNNLVVPALGLLAAPVVLDVAISKMSGHNNVRWNLTKGAMRYGGRAVGAIANVGGQLLNAGAREGWRLARANPRGALIVGGIVAAGAGCVYIYNRLSGDGDQNKPEPAPIPDRQPQDRTQQQPRQPSDVPPNQSGTGTDGRTQNGGRDQRTSGGTVPNDSELGPPVVQTRTPQQQIDDRNREENARRQRENQLRHGQGQVPTPPWQRPDGSMGSEIQTVPQPLPNASANSGGDAMSRLLQRSQRQGR